MRLHRVLVSASRVTVLDGMHQSIVALLQAGLTKAAFIDGHEPMLQHGLNVHHGIIESIRLRDRQLFGKTMALHHDDLIRADDPRRSPVTAEASAP